MSLPRLCLIASSLFLVIGCATRSDEAPAHAFAAPPGTVILPLGQVSTSGTGPQPPYAALKATLREVAARQYGLPVDEIVVGPVEVDGGAELTTQSHEIVSAGVAAVAVAVPTDHKGPSYWTATAEVRRKLPKQD